MANKKTRPRTYARNRAAHISRRGYEKVYESDSLFFLKLIIYVILGTVWLLFQSPIAIGPFTVTGVPIGLLIGLIAVNRIEQYQFDRKILYILLIITAVVSFFRPTGIMI